MQRNMVLAGGLKLNKPVVKKTNSKKEEPVKESKGFVEFVKKNKEVCIVAGGIAANYAYKYYQDKYVTDDKKPPVAQ